MGSVSALHTCVKTCFAQPTLRNAQYRSVQQWQDGVAEYAVCLLHTLLHWLPCATGSVDKVPQHWH
jgi:hypothetical protein